MSWQSNYDSANPYEPPYFYPDEEDYEEVDEIE